jgi:hypothetical protein
MHLPRRRPLQRGQSALQLPADKPSLPSGDCTECLDGLWGCPSVEMHRSAGAVGRQKRAELIVEKFNLRSPTQHEQTATQQRGRFVLSEGLCAPFCSLLAVYREH